MKLQELLDRQKFTKDSMIIEKFSDLGKGTIKTSKMVHSKETIVLYRAMSLSEFKLTMRNKKLSFGSNSKFKWFSPSLRFIKSRVRDGKFNNSDSVHDRYDHIVKFTFTKTSLDVFKNVGNNELMLNVRKVPFIRVVSVKDITNK